MPSVCFYFQVHQPYRIKELNFLDLSRERNYFDDEKNRKVLEKVVNKCYLPATKALLDLVHHNEGKFRFSFSFTGIILEQLLQWAPQVLDNFVKLHNTGCVEILSETYHHSLSSLFSPHEFQEQIQLHTDLIQKIFGVKPQIFRNTELIYSDHIGDLVYELGYKGVIGEGADQILGWRSPNYIYHHPTKNLKILLKNYKLSDDVAFRFNNKSWKEYPLTVEKYVGWLVENQDAQTINLFMDFETFGEHQTGSIFDFLKKIPHEVLKHKNWNFLKPSEVISKYESVSELSFPKEISWADLDRDLSAWRGNEMQERSLRELYELEKVVKQRNNPLVTEVWRKFQASDHFYYMCTKWFSDGDVHAYFSPYQSPYEAFLSYMGAIDHFKNSILKGT